MVEPAQRAGHTCFHHLNWLRLPLFVAAFFFDPTSCFLTVPNPSGDWKNPPAAGRKSSLPAFEG